jgi:hypothetical protein
MTRLAQRLRGRREMNRSRRSLQSAIDNASTPALRDELIMVAQRSAARLY